MKFSHSCTKDLEQIFIFSKTKYYKNYILVFTLHLAISQTFVSRMSFLKIHLLFGILINFLLSIIFYFCLLSTIEVCCKS
ncbi:hypothetical protein BpHYR1_007929 [Brachionus plicatilis]|uniref:Uncharacterized protein n=1 Tax=Brachionus plicatilis TaxID=10195 RepID=A0A3M7PIJ7_BRAPC|nr:hypothetical protein BpHYR1_007929 [Brachionus plicatilis]